MAHPKGGYRNKAGKRVPGVTTICGRFKESGALMFWAYKQGQRAERGEIDSLYDDRDKAAESGTLAHEMVEAYLHGHEWTDPTDVDAEIVAEASRAFDSFLSWWNQSNIEIIDQEMQLLSEAHQFGGCPDAIGKMPDGRLCLVDWKTSSGVYTDYLLQLAAYKILWQENNPDKPLTGGFHLCRFAKKHGDFAHHYFPELDAAADMFLKLRECYALDKQLKERVK